MHANALPVPPALSGLRPVAYQPAFETPEEDEVEVHARLVETLLSISEKTFEDSGLGLRCVHAKSHGLLQGELEVLPLPAPYAQGLFAAPLKLPAWLRLSTTPGDLLDDRVSTPRGLALKVLGVPGPRLPGSESGQAQDFLLVNGPVFLARSAREFLHSLKMLAGTTDRVPRLKLAFSALLRGTEKALEALGGESARLKSLGGHPITHPLGETYFSQVPFLYGPYMAKWSLWPVSPELRALKDAPVALHDHRDGLRQAVEQHFATTGGQWELGVQLCTDLAAMPLEDATVEWDQALSPFVPVARLTVPPQAAWGEERAARMDDGQAFDPWDGLAAHRPLGSINRARRPAYPASAAARSPRGRCPVAHLRAP